MKSFTKIIGENEYTLATTLRVAYVLQGMNNHKSYLDIFQSIGEMAIEEQINVIYAAYMVGNTTTDNNLITKDHFKNICLDNLDLTEMMDIIKTIIEGITGKKIQESTENSIEESSEEKN